MRWLRNIFRFFFQKNELQQSSAPSPQKPKAALQQPVSKVSGLTAAEEGRYKFDSFKYASWGLDDPENRRNCDRVCEDARNNHPTLWPAVMRARESGKIAHTLSKVLSDKIRRGDKDIDAWIRKASNSTRIKKYLIKGAKFEREWISMKVRAKRSGKSGKSSLNPIKLIDGRHPNNLRHLPPAGQWTVLIDETGSVFDDRADEMAPTDTKLGRLVAVVLPSSIEPAPRPGFHSTGVAGQAVDEVLGTLLRLPIGIFGFSVHDPAITAGNWVGHIHQLLRWVLWQLPCPSGQPVLVQCRIEKRGNYKLDESLRALEEILEMEFNTLDPGRFAHLKLHLSIVAKDDSFIGYADAVAFTWGSPSRESKDRLKKSALLGHCLLRPSDQGMERLFMAVNAQGKLQPDGWYELCDAVYHEPDGLLARFLDTLGESVQSDSMLWQSYLSEVRTRLRLKTFHPGALEVSLGWLGHWTPTERSLPKTLQLQLETARVAAANHLGDFNLERIKKCTDLSRELKDEIPEDACEAVLRLAVATTNHFEFSACRPIVEEYLREPIAVPGLLNHAKLHSTLGQLEAFAGKNKAAIACFDRSISALQRLSDPEQISRECRQTMVYRLIAMMDDTDTPADTVIEELMGFLRQSLENSDDEKFNRHLANDIDESRFLHHLWLRALVSYPRELSAERKIYLTLEKQWGHGDEHPWPLIEAYRAWMLKDAGEPGASEAMTDAIMICEDESHGPTLCWMAEVLRSLAQALGIRIDEAPSSTQRTALREQLAHAPHEALELFATFSQKTDPDTVRDALRQCLPFNFH